MAAVSDMEKQSLLELFGENERRTTLLHHLIASLMLGCMVMVIVQFGEALVFHWEGDFLGPLGVLVALEGMYSRRFVRQYDTLSREWLLYRLTEWVVILAGLKLLIYLLTGIEQLWADLPLWRANFVDNFFTGEYLFALAVILLVAGLASMFSEELAQLEGDEKLLRWERESQIPVQRKAARLSLANLIFTIAGGMIFLTGLLRLDWETLWGTTPRSVGGVGYVIAYFVLALILLSLTEFSILRVRWSLEQIPFTRNLAKRWLVYSLIFLLAVGLAAAVLPTRYSVGLLEVGRFLVSLVATLFTLLLIILMTPLFWLMSLLARLVGKQVRLEPPDLERLVPPAPPPPTTGASWVELLKSILFWLVFVGVIGFSIYTYLSQNRLLVERLRGLPVLGSLVRFMEWLRGRLAGVNERLARRVQAGLQRLAERRRMALQTWRYVNPHSLPPRQKVMFYYYALLRRAEEAGAPRRPDQTPLEYAARLRSELPEVEAELGELTGEFVEARYSQHPISDEKASLVREVWERIRPAIVRTLRQRR